MLLVIGGMTNGRETEVAPRRPINQTEEEAEEEEEEEEEKDEGLIHCFPQLSLI